MSDISNEESDYGYAQYQDHKIWMEEINGQEQEHEDIHN